MFSPKARRSRKAKRQDAYHEKDPFKSLSVGEAIKEANSTALAKAGEAGGRWKWSEAHQARFEEDAKTRYSEWGKVATTACGCCMLASLTRQAHTAAQGGVWLAGLRVYGHLARVYDWPSRGVYGQPLSRCMVGSRKLIHQATPLRDARRCMVGGHVMRHATASFRPDHA